MGGTVILQLTKRQREMLRMSTIGECALAIIDEHAKSLSLAEARIAAATEILLGSGDPLASEVLAALRGEQPRTLREAYDAGFKAPESGR